MRFRRKPNQTKRILTVQDFRTKVDETDPEYEGSTIVKRISDTHRGHKVLPCGLQCCSFWAP